MHHKIVKIVSLAAIAAFATAAIAAATVTFDPDSGEGFVGKGDVQLAFAWNNKQLQDNAGGVTFTYNTSQTYEVECYWETGNDNRPHTVTRNESTGVNSKIAYDARKNSKGQQGPITGFLLTGLGTTSDGGDAVPQVGDPCPGEPGNDKRVISVTPVGDTDGGGLYANYGGNSVLIWPPSV